MYTVQTKERRCILLSSVREAKHPITSKWWNKTRTSQSLVSKTTRDYIYHVVVCGNKFCIRLVLTTNYDDLYLNPPYLRQEIDRHKRRSTVWRSAAKHDSQLLLAVWLRFSGWKTAVVPTTSLPLPGPFTPQCVFARLQHEILTMCIRWQQCTFEMCQMPYTRYLT